MRIIFAAVSWHKESIDFSVDGIWNAWGVWGECAVTCGGGLRLRQRTCDGPYYDGADCEGPSNDTEICGTDPCPSM